VAIEHDAEAAGGVAVDPVQRCRGMVPGDTGRVRRQRGNEESLLPGGRRAADGEYSRCGFEEMPLANQPPDDDGSETELGCLASCQSTVARGSELASGPERAAGGHAT
jgi:hypothetical protein